MEEMFGLSSTEVEKIVMDAANNCLTWLSDEYIEYLHECPYSIEHHFSLGQAIRNTALLEYGYNDILRDGLSDLTVKEVLRRVVDEYDPTKDTLIENIKRQGYDIGIDETMERDKSKP